MTGPLTDVVVLDLTQEIAGPYATKLFADFGAEVIKVEPPNGDSSRQLGPFPKSLAGWQLGPVPDEEKHLEKSGTFFYFNTNKRSIAIDLESEGGKEVFWRLVDRADVIVESYQPGRMTDLGIDWETISQRKSGLPLVSITNFGQISPYKDYKGSDLVLYAYAGEMYSTGLIDREPVKMYGTAALVQSGSAAATAIMGAVMMGRWQGVGQHIDFSIADSHLVGVDRRHATVMGYQFSGRTTLRAPASGTRLLGGVYPCQDGWVDLDGGGARFHRSARQFLGHPEWLEDPKWDDPSIHQNPEMIEEFNAHFYVWLMEHTKREIWKRARDARILCGPLFTIKEVFEDENFRKRGVFQKASHSFLGDFEFPGRPFILSDSPWEYRRPAPLLGEHSAEILEECGFNTKEISRLAISGNVGVRV